MKKGIILALILLILWIMGGVLIYNSWPAVICSELLSFILIFFYITPLYCIVFGLGITVGNPLFWICMGLGYLIKNHSISIVKNDAIECCYKKCHTSCKNNKLEQ